MTRPTSADGARARCSSGVGHAHAKAILLGEHAVVYGAPALAVPIPQLTVTARARWAPRVRTDPGDVSFTIAGSPPEPVLARATASLRRLTTEFKATTGVTDSQPVDVLIDGAIPHGRGLGSSAAVAHAVVLAFADLFGTELTRQEVFELVQTAENVMHGRASGVDARAVGASTALVFRAGETQEAHIGCDGVLIVADSGVVGRTKDAVELLRQRFQRDAGARQPFVRRASELTEAAVRDLAGGRPVEFGARLTDYHELLRAAGLSTTGIDALVDAALGAGGLGAKITGAGLGGCVIALARPERVGEVTRRLHEAGAVRSWVLPLSGHATDAH